MKKELDLGELKPCPFCGKTRLEVRDYDSVMDYFQCISCKATGPLFPRHSTLEIMYSSWNDRYVDN